MDRRGTVWLVGMMGSGKSSVGRALATMSGVPFVDTDQLVEVALGMSVADVWDQHGEEAFRDAEQSVIEEIGVTQAVVAAGGGAVIRPVNVETMRRSGVVVWLTAEPGELARRVGSEAGRPLLRAVRRETTLAELLAERSTSYQAAAHHTVATDGRTIDEVAEEVEHLWSES